MRINAIADRYELWGGSFIHVDSVYDRLQFIQAYCNNIKPVVQCSEMMGKLLFDMKNMEKKKKWRSFDIKLDKRIPHQFILIYSKKNSWKTKQPVLWSMVIQFNHCSKQEQTKVCYILLNNLKRGVDV